MIRQWTLPETDGEPLESNWHRMAINFLIELAQCWLFPRQDFFAGGNMFIYFSMERFRNRDYRAPDFFFVNKVSPDPMRRYWAVWEENNKYPNAIIELLSPSTAQEDLTTKKDLYEKTFRTPDYFCYDPDTERLSGWHLVDQVYQAL